MTETKELIALPPYRYCDLTNAVFGRNPKGGEAKVCDIRGWGYLTGRGHMALGLSDEEGRARQENTGREIARLLNKMGETQ